MPTRGRLIGEGRTAEVYEYGEGRVLKLLRPGFDPGLLQEEADLLARAARAGAPAPRVHGHLGVDDRAGIVLDRVPGRSLLDLVRADPDHSTDWAVALGRAHARILDLAAAPGLEDVRERLRSRISSTPALSDRLRQHVLAGVDALPGGDRLLHGDLHPSNVFVGADEDMVIDWGNSSSGSPAADIARTLHLVSPEAIPPDFPERDVIARRIGGFRDTYLETVIGLCEVDDEDVDHWMLPVVVARLDEGIEWERAPLMRRIESLLG